MPEADREHAPIQVVLGRNDHGKSADRQCDASHGYASEEFPALHCGDKVLTRFHASKLGIARWHL